MFQAIYDAFAPVLPDVMKSVLTLVSLATLYLVRTAVGQFTTWTGVQVEEKHMRALHSAVLTGINMAMSKGLTGDKLKGAAIEYVRTSVPDAIKALNPSTGVLIDLITSKLRKTP